MEKPPYLIVRGRLLDTVENRVCEKIAEGYIPHGNLVLSDDEADFLQPMVLKEVLKLENTKSAQ